MVAWVNARRKAITVAVGVIVTIAGRELGEGSKWYQYIVLVVTALGVYAVANKPAE